MDNKQALIDHLMAKSTKREFSVEERIKRTVSFAYGNAKIENADVKRDTVQRETERLYG